MFQYITVSRGFDRVITSLNLNEFELLKQLLVKRFDMNKSKQRLLMIVIPFNYELTVEKQF